MKQILTIHPDDVGATTSPDAIFTERRAARAVMLNEKGDVYLVYMKTRDYYKLPGGGIDEGEDIETALHRELMEECGTDGEIIGEIGSVEEFRGEIPGFPAVHQVSYCYIVKQKGGHVLPDYEQSEQDDGAEVVIVSDIDKAITLIEGSTPVDDECRFMQRRDSVLAREAKHLLSV